MWIDEVLYTQIGIRYYEVVEVPVKVVLSLEIVVTVAVASKVEIEVVIVVQDWYKWWQSGNLLFEFPRSSA